MTDQRAHATTFTYDGVGRRLVSTDPLLGADTLAYDKAGSITKRTRRTGAVSTYGYDLLGRRTTQVYGTATVTRSFDALDRLTRVTGPGGTITRTYDPVGDVASETTSQGTVTSSYDLVGRRVSMQVGTLPATTYAYDAADRVTKDTRRHDERRHDGYDLSGPRRAPCTLGNGVVRTNTWDTAGQLTGIGFARAGVVLGTLAYTYDAAGRLSSVSGTMARVVLPAAVTSAVYDAANRPTSYGGVALTHDADGNLRTDGVRTYTWDTRDRLVGVTGTPAATYAYDDLGRRTSATVGGVATAFAYDDVDIVQEKQGATWSSRSSPGPGPTSASHGSCPAAASGCSPTASARPSAITSDAGSLDRVVQLPALRALDVDGHRRHQPVPLHRPRDRRDGAVLPPGPLSRHDAQQVGEPGPRRLRRRLGQPDPVRRWTTRSTSSTSMVSTRTPPPDDCGFWCSVAKNVAKKLGMDQAKNPGPKGPKDAWKPSPRNEYSDQVKQYGNDAQQNSDRLSNPVKDAWNRASDALGGN